MHSARVHSAHTVRRPATFAVGLQVVHGFECIEMTDAEVQKPAAAEPSPAAHNVLL